MKRMQKNARTLHSVEKNGCPTLLFLVAKNQELQMQNLQQQDAGNEGDTLEYGVKEIIGTKQ